MSLSETATFVVELTLSTLQGELPTNGQVRDLVVTQMDGVLDPDTELECIAVVVRERKAE